MTTLLTVPNTSKKHFNGENDFLKYGGCHMQGWRPTMEDTAITKLDIEQGISIFVVFDGHGSNEVAEFCKDHFVSILKNQEFKKRNYPEALRQACIELDQLIKSPYGIKKLPGYQDYYSNSNQKYHTKNGKEIAQIAGCAACIVLIVEDQVFCANVGDSRCVLAQRQGQSGIKARDLSYDQKPCLEEEKQRIEEAGGFVKNNRIDGNLNLSRALGDHDLKDNESLPMDKQKAIPIPEIQQVLASSATAFLVLACDGIWDCQSSQNCVEYFWQEFLEESNGVISEKVGKMFDQIVAKDPTGAAGHDNMTCIVVQFKGE